MNTSYLITTKKYLNIIQYRYRGRKKYLDVLKLLQNNQNGLRILIKTKVSFNLRDAEIWELGRTTPKFFYSPPLNTVCKTKTYIQF